MFQLLRREKAQREKEYTSKLLVAGTLGRRFVTYSCPITALFANTETKDWQIGQR